MKSYIIPFILFLFFSCSTGAADRAETFEDQPIVPVVDTKKMIEIPGGTYIPFFGQDSVKEVQVATFMMDETLVTNGEFLNFLKMNPDWTKSKILKLYADSNYLKHWPSDFEIPEGVGMDAPVSNVSWYAAKAYAQSVGKRLPTVDEWEYVGVADADSPNASDDQAFTNAILRSYKAGKRYLIPVKTGGANYYGIYDMYGSVWEWTSDFNSVMMTGESRDNNKKDENLYCAGAALTAADLKNYAAFVRFAMRGSLNATYCINNLGFRCVKDILINK